MIRNSIIFFGLILSMCILSCQPKQVEETPHDSVMKRKLANYAKVQLSADLSTLSPQQIKLFSHLIKAADAIDEIYWNQAYGDKTSLLSQIEIGRASCRERVYAPV